MLNFLLGSYTFTDFQLHMRIDSQGTERIVASWSPGISIAVMNVEGLLDIVVELPHNYNTGITEGLLGKQ